MAHAEKCPLCGGSGQIETPPPKDSTQASLNTKLCHGCGGSGWVTVQDPGVPYIPPYIPVPYPAPTWPPNHPWAIYRMVGR